MCYPYAILVLLNVRILVLKKVVKYIYIYIFWVQITIVKVVLTPNSQFSPLYTNQIVRIQVFHATMVIRSKSNNLDFNRYLDFFSNLNVSKSDWSYHGPTLCTTRFFVFNNSTTKLLHICVPAKWCI